MNIYEMYAGQPYEILAKHELQNAEDLVKHFYDFFDEPIYASSMVVQDFGVYPGVWRREEDDSLVQVGPRPEMNREAWEMANRRFASQILDNWEKNCRKYMPDRLCQIAWKEGRGIDEWKDALTIQMIVFFDGDFDPSFTLGMPASPEPLTDAERQALITPVYPTKN